MIEVLKELRKLSGGAKLDLLAQHPELKEILEWTYNPFKMYYVTSPEIIESDIGYHDLLKSDSGLPDSVKDMLNALSTRLLSGNKAISEITYFMAGLKKEQAELLQMIINKDLKLDIGVKTINKIWPGLIQETEDGELDISVYFVSNFKESKIKFPCLAAPKLDGVRGRFKNGLMYSRQKKRILGLEHIEFALGQLGNDFDGEIMVPGNIFDSASGLIRNKTAVPEATFHVFDMPDFKGNKLARYQSMQSRIWPSFIELIPHAWIQNMDELMDAYQDYLSNGYEGIVMYDHDSYYEDKRGTDWMRIVPLKTADVKVIGFFEGEGKLVGTLGGIIVDYKGHECRVGSGFKIKKWHELSAADQRKNPDQDGWDLKVRDNIWFNQEDYLGMIAEVEFKEETKAGSMRQSRFKEWRQDKTEPNVS